MPTDDEIIREGRDRTRYGGSTSEMTRALLWGLEREEARDAVKPVGTLTLEHILPQRATGAWLDALGDDAEETVRSRTHVLGNLTLVPSGWNSSVGRQGFEEKKAQYERTGIYETGRRIPNETRWGREEIDARGERLLRAACALWPWEGPWPEPTRGWQRWRVRYRHAGAEWSYGGARDTLRAMVGAMLRSEKELPDQEVARREAARRTLVEEGWCAEQVPQWGVWGRVEGVPGLVVYMDRSYRIGYSSFTKVWKRLMQLDGRLEVETDAGERDAREPREQWPWRSAWEIEET